MQPKIFPCIPERLDLDIEYVQNLKGLFDLNTIHF
jgi:hypothetical protein